MKSLDMYLVYVTKDKPVTEHVLGPKSDIVSKHMEVFIMKRSASCNININIPFNIKINLQSLNTKPLNYKTLPNILQLEIFYPIGCDFLECS